MARADVVLDCCDNFATRHAVNRACVAAEVPLVSGAAIRFDGQVAVFDTRAPDSPCYHCLFGEGEELEATRCAVMGVFAPVVGIIGATQAAEALKLIAGVGEPLGRPPAAARCVDDALARGPRSARSAVPRVRGPMTHDELATRARDVDPVARARARRAMLALLAALAAPGRGRRAGERRGQSLPDADWKAIKDIDLRPARGVAGRRRRQGASRYAAPGIRQQFGTARNFLAMVRTAYGALIAARYTEFLEGAVIEGRVIQPLRLVGPDNTVRVALYTMEKQPDGGWKIAGCVLAPSTVQAA